MQRHARKGTVPLVFSVDNRVKVIVTQLWWLSQIVRLGLPPSIRNDMIERLGSTYNENRIEVFLSLPLSISL